MKTFYTIFGGKCKKGALLLSALVSVLLVSAQPCLTPPEAKMTGSTTICQGSTTNISIDIKGGTAPWRVVYSINGAVQPEITGIAANPYTFPTSVAGVYAITSVYDAENCVGTVNGGPVTVQVNSLPALAGIITGSTSVCQLTSGVAYSVPAIAGATSYEWLLPAGATLVSGINTDNITIDFSASATSGNIRVRGVNACGNGAWSPNLGISVSRLPQNPGFVIGSTNVCQGQTGVTYATTAMNYATGYEWQLPSGATISSGTNTNQITVDFSPSASSGNVMVRGTNGCGAGQWSAAFTVEVKNLPIAASAISGPTNVCQNQNNLIFNIPPVAYASSYQWEFPAGFTVSGPTTGSSITLNSGASAVSGIIRVRGVNACGSGAFSSNFNLVVNSGPVVNAGNDNSICTGSSYALSSASATNYSSVLWSSSGNGSFDNPTSLNATYTSGSGDNVVTLTLTANGTGSCSPASDNMTLTVLSLPKVNAGADASVCYSTGSYNLTGMAGNYASIQWQALNGTGTFNNPGSLLTTYNPSPGDIAQGFVDIQLTATGNAPCTTSVSDVMTLTINRAPLVNAGADATSCGVTAINLNGTSSFASLVNWTSSGSGTFMNQNQPTAIYTPSTADVANGSVQLTITASALAPCSGSVSDNMTLTLNPLPTVNAGPDVPQCGAAPLNLSGSSASNYGSLLWSSSGNGTFSSPTALHPVYTPSAADAMAGSVTLTLTAFGTGACTANSVSDQMEIFINPQPTVNAGSPASMCESTSFTVTDATASNYTGLTWSSNGSGTFLNNGTLTSTYTPSLADVLAGSVNLTLTATPIAPCASNVTSVKVLSITRGPVVNAGPDASICGLTPYATSGATANNASSYLWSSSGSGSFVNPTLLNATYVPGAGDLLSGSVTLTLSVNGNSPCATPVTDELILTVNNAPIADAGSDGSTCETLAFTVSTATASNYSTLQWSTSGSGILSNAGTLMPTYTPSHNDALVGTVILTLTVTGNAPCTSTVSDHMQIVVTPSPIVSAGANFDVCAGSEFMVPGATAQHYSALNWTSSGTGTIVNANTLTPNYTPSVTDIANGTITLTLTATGNAPCVDPVSHSILVTINQTPEVFAGNDITICEGPHNITGATATNFDALLWSSNGDGVFTNATALHAIYTPGPADIINGIITLTLTATSIAPCTSTVSDNVLYTIRPLPESYAGPNSTVCEGGSFELINATATHYTSLNWSTSGSGNFSNQNTLNPTYTPSLADIANGSVLLTLTANNPPCTPVTSTMTLSIRQNPVANAGTDGAICEGGSYMVYNAGATNSSSILWAASGSGVLQNPTTLNPTYIPSAADIMIGSVQLTMTVQAIAPCIATDVDVMEITITRSATAFAGNDATICSNQTHTIVGSNAGNYSSLAWSTSGDGIILAANTLYPTYIPGTIDESLGFAALTLTAYGNSPCTGNATDQMMLTVVPEPVVNAGPDIQICVGANVPLINASASSTSSVYWSTAGSGTFSDPTLLNPVYTPSPQDISNGTVILNITGQGVAPCSGSDTDAMILKISQPPVVNAGSDGEICETEQYYIHDASATNYSAITWTSMGDGSFSNHNSINPTYTPGPADIAAGSVLLYLNATSLLPCSGSVSDAMLLIIHPMPQINAGPNANVCETDTYLLSGATALDYSALLWTSSGSGWFSNVSVLNPIYTPSASDIINGNVTLTLTATGLLPCNGQVTEQMVLNILKSPIVDAGIDETICVGSFTLTNASASNYHTLHWVSSGSSGTLLNANTITPTFQPSAADIAAGSVVLTLTATPNTPCAGNSVDQMTITIRPLTVVSAGSDETICQGSTYTPNTATAVNYTAINWTTSGSGSFTNANTLIPTYTPSPGDIALGWITLTLNATSIAPCTQNVSDNMILTIIPQAVVDAGLNSTICEGGIYSTSGASVTHHTSLLWTSSGSGTFANDGLLVTNYTPSAADIANGSVMLTLTAISQAPCTLPISDFMILTIQPAALVNAGPDARICENESYLVSGATAKNYNALLWTTSGNGTFVDGTTLSPTYTPGSADRAAGSVILTLTAQPKSPCTAPHSDSFILTVDPLAIVDAGADDMVCEGTGLLITDASANDYSALNWTTTGTGTFDNGSTISPTYYPSAEDVANGSVILTLTANSQLPCNGTAVDSKIVTVTPMPVVNAGPDDISCGAAPYAIVGASASTYATVNWTTSGTGVFTNANIVNSTYNPSAADILNGSVTLTLTTNSAAPCLVNPSDAMVLSLQPEATANAGADATVCATDSYTVFDATATHYSTLNWTTDGTGVFINANTLTPTYTPSAADALAGSVTLMLTSYGVSPCGNASDTKTLIISPMPMVNAGADDEICFGKSYTLSLSSVQHQSSVNWTTSGSGTFANSGILHTVYTPSAADLLAGQVILTITANATAPCHGTVSDFMILMFKEGPLADAGADATICESSVFTVSTASATNYLSLAWTTSGTGSFTLGNTLTPTYTPGTADLLTGSVILTLHAYGNPPCSEHSNDMVLTFAKPVTAYAGADVTVCEGQPVIVADATAHNYSSVIWTTSGSGVLANANTLTPTYTPSAGDLIAGSLNLTLTAYGTAPCNGQITDVKVVTITPSPIVNAGIDANLCQGNTFTVSTATASGTASLNWTTSGSGSFTGNGTLTPTYTPSLNDFVSGSVTLTLTGTAVSPCNLSAVDAMVLTLIPSAIVNAGVDANICETENYTVSTASASNYSSIIWTTNGSGILLNPGTLTPTYTPSAADIAGGTVTLTLSALSKSPCNTPVSDYMILSIEPMPEVTAGADATICEGQSYTVTGASATTGISFIWTSNGTGNFIDNHTLTPTYTPSPADISAGSVTLTLTLQASGVCNTSVNDNLVLTIDPMATVNAGADVTVCQGLSYTLIDATATNFASVMWSTSGSGTFGNPALVNATYNPSVIDIQNGSVTLTLTATTAGVCTGTVNDMMTLNFNTLPIVNAGPDMSSCDAAVTLNGSSASNFSSLLWTSSGTGTLSNATTLSPTYVPSATDISNGFVNLTLTAQATAPCTGTASDMMRLELHQGPVVSAGNDGNICASSTFTINGANATNAALITWTTSGSGTFSNANILNPVYTPGVSDLSNGNAILTITATPVAPCSSPVSDNLTLTITPVATAYAGIDATSCSPSFMITGATATNYSTFTWVSSGSGSFINQTTLTPTYQPSLADFAAGSVEITLQVQSQSPCNQLVTDAMTLTLMNTPTANAGNDDFVCQGTAFTVTTATATNYNTLNWTSSGSGTFASQTMLNAVYTPSAADIANGSVTLTLTATAASPCSNTATDEMLLTIVKNAIANAGADISICEGSNYVLSGTVANSTLFTWISNGTGTFTNGSTLSPTYSPSAADIAAGSVTITLTAFAGAPCSIPSTDQMILTITRQPFVNAGADATSCGSNFAITTATASHYNSLAWSTTGTGTFINPNAINPTYVASLADMTAGSVMLTLTATGNTPCTASVSDQMVLMFSPAPTVNAGADDAVCGNSSYAITGASAVNYSTLTWSTSGTGTFSNTTMLNPVYIPSTADIASGTVVLTLTATSLAPCSSTSSDQMTLIFNMQPMANAGPDINSCGTVARQINGATASNYSSLSWTHNGTGTMSGATSLNPTYTPSQGDVINGQITLTLHANAIAPCTGEATDAMIIYLQSDPLANAGANQNICEGQNLTLSGATASGYASVGWSSNGSGTFSSTTAVNPIYYPSAADIATGSVNLTLTLQGAPPCNTIATDMMALTIQKLPIANAGSDDVCCSSTYQLIHASAANYSAVNWTTNGSGFFTNSNLVNAVYTPSSADITGGLVVLTLTATGSSPCNNQTADQMTLTIGAPVLANAGNDESICGSSSFTVSTASASNYNTINWTTSGSGTFANQASLHPTYTPSAGDRAIGSVTLTLHVQGNSPCFNNVQDNMLLTLVPGVTANAGPDAQICTGKNFTVTGATALNHAAISWSTTGTGTITSGNTLSPTYVPSAQDYLNGSVMLTLSAVSMAPCSGTASDEMMLTFVEGPLANAGPDAEICFGVNFTVTGASASGYQSIVWTSTGSGTLVNANSLSPSYMPSNADRTAGSVNLILTVNGAAPCFGSKMDVMTLTISSLPVASGIITGPQDVCAGQTGVSYSVTPISGATSYNWILPSGATIVAGAGTSNITVDFSLSAVSGSLYVNGKSACGNGPVSVGLPITISPIPGNPGIIMGPASICQNSSGIEYSINPVSGATAYQWTVPTGATIVSGTGTNTIVVDYSTSALSGNITVTPQNFCGSSNSATLSVTVKPMPVAPIIAANGPIEFCEGGSVVLSATPGYASYLWSNGMTTPNITVTVFGTYSVIASDASGCASLPSNEITVNVHMLFVPEVIASGPTNLCEGGSVTLSAPAGYASYLWNNGSTSKDIIVTTSGQFNVTLTDAFGCTSLPSADIAVNVHTAPATPVIVASGPISFCAGGSVTLSAPVGFASYLWSNGETTQSILVNSSGVFSVIVSGLNGCNSMPSASVTVNVHPYPATPVITALGPTSFCKGESVILSAPAGYTSYLWSNGATTQNTTITTTGIYTVVVSDAIGCTSQPSAPVAVEVLQPITPTIVANGPTNFCDGGSVVLTASTGHTSYLWSNGETTQSITASVSGSYTVQVEDAMGCISEPSNSIVVTVYPPTLSPVITANGATTICIGSSVKLIAPVGYASYIWSNGQTTREITVNTAGSYYVIVSDANGCSSAASNTIVVDVVPMATASAGSNATICAGDNFNISGATATNYSLLTWTSSGSGYFVNNGNLNPTYVPSTGDLSTGSVILTLSATGIGPCNMAAESSLLLNFTNPPTAYAGVDFTVCEGTNISITTATATHYQSINWTTSGSGMFLNGTTLTPTYIPSVLDVNNGIVSLTLTAVPVAPCAAPATDALMVTLHEAPTVFAGNNTSVCPPDQYTTITATASNYTSLLWTTNGTGTFTDPTALVTVYSPSAADISNGSVTLNLTAYANAPCATVSDDVVLILVEDPHANAGPDMTMCEGNSAIITGIASGYQSIFWTTSGTGTIVNGNTLTPTYLPSLADITSGWVTLTLTANPLAPCAIPAIDAMLLKITRKPLIFAGNDASLCPAGPYTTSTATAAHYSTLLWTTNGTGTFSNTTTAVTVYTPSAADIANGTVTLTLTGNANSPCASVSDQMVLLLSSPPIANAGPDHLICEGSNVSITGAIATHYQTLNWATSGTGTIVNGNSISPMYIPSAADINAGTVILSLTATPIAPCAGAVSDATTITIERTPQIFAGDNISLCPAAPYTTNSATAAFASLLQWSTNGTGSFSNVNALVTTYTPSATDITNGNVTLTLTGFADTPCSNVSDDIVLSISEEAVVYAGADVTICEGMQHTISGASASNYQSIGWSGTGTGVIMNGNTLTPTYIPSMADIANGGVVLSLNATPLAPCSGNISDAMQLTITRTPAIYAGADAAICPPGAYTVNDATAVNYAGLNWSTSGTGTFSNTSTLVTIYNPSSNDIAAGTVTLTLTGYANSPCANASDDVVLYFVPEATAVAGPDAIICEGSQHLITGATATNYSTLTWTTSGTGVFVSNSTLTPTYIPSAADINNGTVILTLTAAPIAPCAISASDALILTIERTATVNAGPNASTCNGDAFNLAAATAAHYSDVLWTTSGTGTFTNPTELNATYLSSADDLAAGNVTLTIVAYGNAPCADATDFMVLNITPGATVDAGDDQNICYGPAPVTGASATNYASLQWTVAFGSGTIINAGNIMPTYVPSAGDLANGYAILTLTVNPLAPCNMPIADNKTISISETPIVNAGLDATICAGSSYTLNDATALNYAMLQWSSSGSGTWLNANTLNPTYSPGTADITAGSVILTLTATNGNCPVVTDYMQLNILQEVKVNAGADNAICEGSNFNVTGATASNYSSLIWTTSGSGTFSNTAIIDPVYSPSLTDIASGSVVLTLSGNSSAPCNGSASDNMTLILRHSPVADAGTDGLVCQGEEYVINDALAYNYASVVWTSTGTGTFVNGSSLNATYIPSPADITAGSVTLTLVASNPPCADATNSQSLTIIPAPLVNAGPDVTICNSCNHTISGAVVNNAVSFNWSSNGTGTFTNGNTLSPTYQPSAADVSIGSVTLILTAESASGCGSFSDEMVITINQNPDLDFTWAPVCEGQPTQFTVDTTLTNVNSIAVWHWNFGDGFYANVIDPAHTFPATGNYLVTLTATDTAGYTSVVKHTVQIISSPIAFFSIDEPNCQGNPTQFNNLSSTENGYITRWIWNYGDGSTPDTIFFPDNANVAHQYANSGIYGVSLNVLNSHGCENTFLHQITITPAPIANFYYTTLCEDMLVNFQDASFPNGAGNVVSWSWNFDDPASGINNTSQQEDPQHIFSAPGIYNVTLTINNFTNCGGTITKEVHVGGAPNVDFTWQSACATALTSFFADETVINIGAISSFAWNFGDGGTSALKDPEHQYAVAGNYTVSLSITDTSGCSNSITHVVSISKLPVAFFNYTAATCLQSETQFSDQSQAPTGYITEWEWLFGDGTSTTVTFPNNPNVAHTYAATGTYNVTLKITTSEGCENMVTRQVTVVPNPVANFTSTPSCVGEPVTFTDLSQANGSGHIVSHAWDFGDPGSGVNNTSSLQNPSHTYSQAGNYTVTLTVTTSNSCQNTISKVIAFTPAPPVAFVITTGTCVGESVSFVPDETIMDLTTIASYTWNFGDGTPVSSIQSPDHVYNVAGTFNVTLTVMNHDGCANSITQVVSIGAAPVAAFTFTSGCIGNGTSFNDLSYVVTGEAITSWNWNFNDPNATPGSDISTLKNPVYHYSEPGLYYVTLTVTSASGCAGSITLPAQVFPAPNAAFSYTTNPCANGTVSFQDNSSSYMGAIVSWEWEFAPGYTTTLQNPSHTYYHTDSCYSVKLMVTDMRGCTDTVIQEVCIPAGLQVAIEVNNTCHGDSTHFNPVVISPQGDSLIAFVWNFDDANSGIHNTSRLKNPVHYFKDAGSYLVSLHATDQNNCETTVYKRIEVLPLPLPSFTYTAGSCDSTIYFTDLSVGNGNPIATWIWNFGDGTIETMNTAPENISHFYATPGTFSVSLTTITSKGCEATYTMDVTCMPCIQSEFTQLDALVCERHEITFADASVCGNPIDEWVWTFGDGTSLVYHTVQPTVSHIYQQSGTYQVKLVVTTTLAGKTVSASTTHTVKVLASPVAEFFAPDVCLNQNTNFMDQSTWKESKIQSWFWDFGDPTSVYDTTSARNPAYHYQLPGSYPVSLKVTNTFGCSDTASTMLQVFHLPEANFSYSLACENNHTFFTDKSDSGDTPINQWWWRFTDTTTMLGMAGVQHPDFIFKHEGDFNVSLIVVDPNGCSDTTAQEIRVNPKPISAFSHTENYENTQGRVLFTNGSIGAEAYVWNFGTSLISYEIDPVVDFPNDGNYKVSLVSLNEFGCPDTLSMNYNFMFKGLWVPNAFSPGNPNASVRQFKPVGINLSSYTIEVYDTWGNMMWTSSELDEKGSPVEGWNGVFNGNLQTQDVFMWKATAVFKDGSIWRGNDVGNSKKMPQVPYGTVTLIR